VKAAKLLRAATVIPCHYNTFPPIQQDADAFKTAVEAGTASRVTILDVGGSIEV
jgi:L-ascorbate metabolism protein UlaG (beta-lactamase superfamily)